MFFAVHSLSITEQYHMLLYASVLCYVYHVMFLMPFVFRLTNVNPPTTVFRSKIKGVVATPPGLLTSRPNVFVKLFMGMFSGSEIPMVIVNIFYLYRVILKLMAIQFVLGCLYLGLF